MRTLSFLSLFLAVLSLAALADPVEQSDWSGGGGVAGPVVTWGDRFDSSSAASWLAIPGQVALSSARLAPPVPHVLGTGTQAFGVRAGDLDVDTDWPAAFELFVDDVDRDGRPDILSGSWTEWEPAWWRNGGGDPIAWTRYNAERNLFGAVTSRAANLDGDGALEVLGAGYSGGGGFAWYEIAYFLPTGSLTSSILDLGSGCAATGIDWTAEMPAGTDVRFQVRGSPDPGDLGAWSADILTPGPFPASVGRYVQYRAVLATSDSTRLPIVRSVRLARDATGVEGGPPPLLGSLSVRPNPFNPEAAITFVLDRGGPVRVSIHDIAGREIVRLDDRTLPAGTHGLVWTGDDAGGRPVPSGAYFVRVETVAARLSEKLLLIR
jgi:hypothetical protein